MRVKWEVAAASFVEAVSPTGCASHSHGNAIGFEHFRFTCSVNFDLEQAWHPVQEMTLHWIALNFGLGGLPSYPRRGMNAALGAAHRLMVEPRATSDMFARFADGAHRVVVPYGGRHRPIRERIRPACYPESARPLSRRDRASRHGHPRETKVAGVSRRASVDVAAEHRQAHIVLIGDNPCEYSDVIRRMISTTGFADGMSRLQIAPSAWGPYAISDVLVSASDIDSLPRPTLECMAFGIPVASTNVFPAPELVEDGLNDRVHPARDLAALIAALRRVLSLPPEMRRSVGDAARDTVEQGHDSSNYRDAYSRLLADAMQAR